MRTPRSECGCAVVLGKIFFVGGYNWNASKRLSDVESFDTDTHTWGTLQDIGQPLTGVGATALTIYEQRKGDNKTQLVS